MKKNKPRNIKTIDLRTEEEVLVPLFQVKANLLNLPNYYSEILEYFREKGFSVPESEITKQEFFNLESLKDVAIRLNMNEDDIASISKVLSQISYHAVPDPICPIYVAKIFNKEKKIVYYIHFLTLPELLKHLFEFRTKII